MDYVQLDFLAFEGIDESVDTAYRAFLDVSLLQLAAKPFTTEACWEEILDFRRRELYAPRAGDVESILDQLISEGDPLQSYKFGFLYWFDVRAAYWIERKSKGEKLHELISPETMRSIFNEFLAIQQRLSAANEFELRKQQPGVRNGAVYRNDPAVAPAETVTQAVVNRVCDSLRAILNEARA